MSFSFTAPQFTVQQHEEERNALSEEERDRIEAEIRGTSIELDESPEMIETLLREFHETLESIPESNKVEYLEAMNRCPQLVKTESDPIRFLRSEGFRVENAVQRFVYYWSMRRRLFGEDKAFLPLTLLGDKGAMHDVDYETIKGIPEYYFVLPNKDDHGRVVFLTDKTRVDFRKYHRNSVTRVFWYMMHVALEQEVAQKRGVVVVAVMRVTHLGQMDRRQQVLTFQSLGKALPIRIAAAHMCHPPSFFSVVWPVLAFVMDTRTRQRCYIRKGTEYQVLVQLNKYGISTAILPKARLGGDYILDIDNWIEQRRLIETERMYNDAAADAADADAPSSSIQD